MLTIYKYRLYSYEGHVSLPEGSKVLHIDKQPGVGICVWALIDTEQRTQRTHRYSLVGTGHDMKKLFWEPKPEEYVGTVMDPPFVWHLFLEVFQ